MQQTIDQLPLATRIPALADAVVATRQRIAQATAEEAEYLDHLARAEAEVQGKAAGSEGVSLSGLIDHNPYLPGTPPTGQTQGDATNPTTGESSGGSQPTGS